MNKTVIVTDSTADIPADLAKQHNIHIVPLKLMFGEDSYLDGVEITPGEFYKSWLSRHSFRRPLSLHPQILRLRMSPSWNSTQAAPLCRFTSHPA